VPDVFQVPPDGFDGCQRPGRRFGRASGEVEVVSAEEGAVPLRRADFELDLKEALPLLLGDVA